MYILHIVIPSTVWRTTTTMYILHIVIPSTVWRTTTTMYILHIYTSSSRLYEIVLDWKV
jgi:hypothetical protein